MPHNKLNTWNWLLKREMGIKPPLGFRDRLHSDLFSSIMPYNSWDPYETTNHTHHGGIFNLEFSPEGSVLVAACEKKSILIFDPLNRKLIHSVDKAHNDCVNCVKFLDSRIFATCSDDHTVALWDIRFLKTKMRSLQGHSNWVKNVEYAANAGLLVTSGFDGSIYTWNINKYTEKGVEYQQVFHTNGLMRTKLTPDGSKLILSTTGGYLILVHDLDLTSLANDWQGFKPNAYRLMQLSNTPIFLGFTFNHLFDAPHNRMEIISDFPRGNDAEVIASLQVHPQGWCVLSRNTSSDENTEWTCVHDIQNPPPKQLASSLMNEGGSGRRSSLALAIDQLTNPSRVSSNSSNYSFNSQARRISLPSPSTSESVDFSSDSNPRRVSCSFPDILGWCSPLFSQHTTLNQYSARELHHMNGDWPSARGPHHSNRNHFTNRGSHYPTRDRSSTTETNGPNQEGISPRSSHQTNNDPSVVVEIQSDVNEVSSRESQQPSVNESPPIYSEMLLDRVSQHPILNQSSNETLSPSAAQTLGRRSLHSSMDHCTSVIISEDQLSAVASLHPSVDLSTIATSDHTGEDQPSAGASHHPSDDQLSIGVSEPSTGDRSSSRFQNALLSSILESSRTSLSNSSQSSDSDNSISNRATFLIQSNATRTARTWVKIDPVNNSVIHANTPRLTHFIEEPNVGRGFIKELCFSSDGRLICSPFKFGVRLLAFHPKCMELSDCQPDLPMKLYEVSMNVCHSSVVVTTKFSPTHCMLVSGCLNGKIAFHHPLL